MGYSFEIDSKILIEVVDGLWDASEQNYDADKAIFLETIAQNSSLIEKVFKD